MRSRDTIALRSQGRWILFKFDEIDAVVAHQHAALLQIGKTERFVRETLTAIEKQLPREKFYRVNRGTVVNADRVRAIHPKSHGDAIVELVTGRSFILSRRYRPTLDGFLSKLKPSKSNGPVRSHLAPVR